MWGVGALRFLLASLLALATVLPAACARSASPGRTSEPADCIMLRTINDFDVLDANDLVIHGPGDTAYHVVLTTPSIGIEGEIAIGVLDDGDGRVCPYGRDAIIIEGALTEEIRIRSIDRIDTAELEALQVQFGVIEASGPEVTPEQIL
jgi:Family of unknown function (DUF6491)